MNEPLLHASIWDPDPPVMARLRIADVAIRLGASLVDLASAASLGRATVVNIIRTNRWPRHREPRVIQERLSACLAARGATPEELATLFCSMRGAANPVLRGKVAKPQQRNNAQESEDMLLPKQTLTPQAARHFKLFRNPFEGPVERLEQFFANDDIRYVREVMWQCAQNASFVAVVGESGAGKTTLLADLEERLARESRGLLVFSPSVLGMEESESAGHRIKAADILHCVITVLDSRAAVPRGMQARTECAQRLLAASARAGNSHLLVLEEAHSMPDTTLKHLKRLHEMRMGRKSLLGILLLGQPELRARLESGLRAGTLREVAQRCELVDLLPLDDDVAAYMECRARALNRPLDSMVLPEAVEQLKHRLIRKQRDGKATSLLYPLSVNNAVTRAMNLAAAIGAPVVNADVMKGI